MAEDELMNMQFDPSSKKKKKKTKKLADFDDEAPASSTTDDVTTGLAGAAAGTADAGVVDTGAAAAAAVAEADTSMNDDMDGPAAAEPLSANVRAVVDRCLKAAERVAAMLDEAGIMAFANEDFDFEHNKKRKRRTADTGAADEDLMGEFSLDTKKKKKKKAKKVKDLEGEDEEGAAQVAGTATAEGDGAAAMDIAGEEDRDYTYKEMLDRLFAIMRAANPDYGSGDRRRFVMKPPQVQRIGTKKSGFINFLDICKMLHRQPDHLMAFLSAELGTTASVDSSNCLIIKGRFNQKNIESVLRKYIRDYVTCHTCKSPSTILTKSARMYFLQCETCGSRCSVASIKSGFQAVTQKRAAVRAKAQ